MKIFSSHTTSDFSRVRNFHHLFPGMEVEDVPDPWYGSAKDFREYYDLIDRACDMILADLVARSSKSND